MIERLYPTLWIGLLSLATAQAADPNDFLVYNFYFNGSATATLPGRLYVPDNYDPAQSYPVVVFYHGAGERGNNNTSQVNNNINNLLTRAKNRDFFLYAGQVPSNNWWNEGNTDHSMRVLSNITRDYNIDESRMYVTGLSMGGSGTWGAKCRYNNVIAAAVPICGVDTATVMRGNPEYGTLVGEPIWAYHAANDGTVSPNSTRSTLNAVRALDGGKPALTFPLAGNDGSPYYSDGSTYYEDNHFRYSEYASGGHGIWGRVYNEEPMYDWLLSHSSPVEDSRLQAGESLIVDFGNQAHNAADSQGRTINTMNYGYHNTVGAVEAFCFTTNGRNTLVSLDVKNAFDFHTGGGSTALYDQDIGTDGWQTPSNTTSTLLLRGLTPGGSYVLECYGSTSSNNRMSRYQVGGQFGDLNAKDNATSTVDLTVVADSQGWIEIDMLATPGSGSTVAQISTLKVTALASQTDLDTWRANTGLDSGGADDLDTPAGDGVPNLLKFAFNMADDAAELNAPNSHPLASNGDRGLPRVEKDGSGALRLTYVKKRDLGQAGITYAVQAADSLAGPWTELVVTPVVTTIDSEWERVSCLDTVTPPAGQSRFLRVAVNTQ